MESLPNEVCLLIFRYLHKFDIIYSFANLNHRFQQIIEPYYYEINLAANGGFSLEYKYFHLFKEHILPLNGTNVHSRKLNHYQQIRLLEPHINRFTNLESLDIGCEIEKKRNFLQKALTSLPFLSKLSISSNAPDDILKTISSHTPNNLNTLILCYWKGLETLNDDTLQMPYIKHFSVTVQSIEILVKLVKIMPNLEELCLSMIEFNGLEKLPPILKIPPTLNKLHLEIGSYNYYSGRRPYNPQLKQIKQFVNLLQSQIRSLTLIAINVDDKDFSNFDKFQSLVSRDDHFIRFEKFEYHFNTIHQPDSPYFPNVEQLSDSTYSIYTLPKPLPFDNGSKRTMFDFNLHRDLTLQELLNCKTLKIDSNGGYPSNKFELKRDLKFVNLQKIVCEDPIDGFPPETCEYLTKIINLSPNLIKFKLEVQWTDTREVIQRIHEVFGQQNGKQIKYFNMPICSVDNETSYPFPELFSQISSIFPNLRELEVYVEQKELNHCYQSITGLIEEIREKFSKLVHLTLRMWLRDECDRNGFEVYKANLNELSNSLYYSAINSHSTYYYLNIWL